MYNYFMLSLKTFSFTELQDQVLRVFKADQQSRYLLINRDTTAREAANQAMREFGMTASAEAFSLCEVSVTPEGVIKQRRLPDQLSKLADRIQLTARFGLKLSLMMNSDGLFGDFNV